MSITPPTLPDYVRLHAKWRPNSIATIDCERQVSWRDLNRCANQLANAITRTFGNGEVRVATLLSPSCAAIEVLAGLMKAGCTTVPLNPSVTSEGLERMIADSQVSGLIISSDWLGEFGDLGASLGIDRLLVASDGASRVDWQCLAQWLDGADDDEPATSVHPGRTFDVIYSSGTTGLPKGIAHSFRSRTDWSYDLAIAFRYRTDSRTLLSTGLHSNLTWICMLSAFLTGSTIVLERGFDPSSLIKVANRERVTHLAMVPVQYQRLLDHPEFPLLDTRAFEALICAGSALPTPIKQRLLDDFPCGVLDVYGATEGVVTLLEPKDAAERLTSVGRPLPGTDIRIISEDGSEARPGDAGEIVFRSRYVMSGYWDKAEVTEDATWRDAESRPWLRSGDIGRVDPDGFLYIIDRKKDMILSGGQNIYPADLEALLYKHPDVMECAVIGVPSQVWGETPFALVVPRPGSQVQSDALKLWANSRLGRQQRLSDVQFRSNLPRNPTGKILKRQLRSEFWRDDVASSHA